MSKEPSMEEILSSIKRIIAEEGEEAVRSAPRAPRRGSVVAAEVTLDDDFIDSDPGESAGLQSDEILELTDEILAEEPVIAPVHQGHAPAAKAAVRTKAAKSANPDVAEDAPADDGILSVASEVAARHSLSALSSIVVKPTEGEDNTLEGLVRAMLRPMLKDWLDAQLPEMVEAMVAKEIARITGRL